MKFYVGLHIIHQAWRFERCFISVTRIRERRSGFGVGEWIMDSGAFTEIAKYGDFRNAPADYAAHVNRWATNGNLIAAVTEDYMCEPFMLARTGMTIKQHQELTIERYDKIAALSNVYIIPVLQGYDPLDYAEHLEMYGNRLKHGAWVGVGSVCKRNKSVGSVAMVLSTIKMRRPDLRLHGFGLKTTSLQDGYVRGLLHSADSMAWSFAARREGRDANSWEEAMRFTQRQEVRAGYN